MEKEYQFNYTYYFLKCLKSYNIDLYNKLIKNQLFFNLNNIRKDSIRLLLEHKIYRYNLPIKYDAFKHDQSHPIIDIILDRIDYHHINFNNIKLLLIFGKYLWNLPMLNNELIKLYNENVK